MKKDIWKEILSAIKRKPKVTAIMAMDSVVMSSTAKEDIKATFKTSSDTVENSFDNYFILSL